MLTDDKKNEARKRQHQAVAQMSAPNRLAQLRSYQRQSAEQWAKLIVEQEYQITRYPTEALTAEDKRRYTLAYNGMRKLLKKILHSVLP